LGKIHSVGIPSPNPNYPQKIRNVSTDNLFDGQLELGTISSTTGQNMDGENRVRSKNYIAIPTGSTAIRIIRTKPSLTFGVRFYNASKEYINSTTYYENAIYDVTLPNGTKYIRFVEFSNDLTSQFTVTTDLTVNKYIPVGIQIKKCNKNFVLEDVSFSNAQTDSRDYFSLYIFAGFPGSYSSVQEQTITSGGTISTTGKRNYTFVANKDFTKMRIRHSGAIKDLVKDFDCNLKEGKTYTISLNITGTNPSVVGGLSFDEVQVEEGSIATPYIAHAEKTYNFPLSEGQKLMQDGKIEDKVVNEWGEIILDGTENWILYKQSEIYAQKLFPAGKSNNNTINGFCNYCSLNVATNVCYDNNNHTGLDFKNLVSFWGLEEVSIEAWKTYLANLYANGKPLTIQYPLATPDETPFTEAQQSVIDEIIKDGTYKEATHYTAEASINPDMEIGYYKNFDSIINKIENLDSRLSLLE